MEIRQVFCGDSLKGLHKTDVYIDDEMFFFWGGGALFAYGGA
jgi:hypothetical protein